MEKLHTLTIVGVGLIGGSIGLAAKQRGLAERVIGVGRRRAPLDQAQQLGAIDEGLLDLQAGSDVKQRRAMNQRGPIRYPTPAQNRTAPGTPDRRWY